jgi:hypothetical protein
MSVQFASKQTKTPQPERVSNPTQVEAPIPHTATGNILQLQRLVGNKGIQRLMAEGKLQRQLTDVAMVRQKQAQVQRQCTCGCCNGVHDEQEEQSADQPKMAAQVQRFWNSDEEQSSEGGGIMDWVSDTANQVAETVGGWFGGNEEANENNNDTPPVEYREDGVGEIPQVKADCLTNEGIGFGSGKGVKINLHGKTVANYDHAQPIPEPFPDGVTVSTSKVGDKDVFSANGKFDVTFTASPSISLPTVPTGLTPCQEKAVQDFIDGKLAAHEQAHADAFTNNYDGTATLSINQKNILDTPDQRKRAVENPIQAEDVKRITAANAASGKLDPWNETVTGLDCKEPEETEE